MYSCSNPVSTALYSLIGVRTRSKEVDVIYAMYVV